MERRPINNQFGHDGGGVDPRREHLSSGLQHSTGLSLPQTGSSVQYDGVNDLPNLSPINAAGPNPSPYVAPWVPADPSLASFLPNYGGWTSYPTDDDLEEDTSQFVQENVNPAPVNPVFMSSNDYFQSLSQPDSASTEDGLYTSRARSHSEHFDVLGGMAGVDFTNLAQGGFELYTESLQQWTNTPSPDTKTYDPFGTPHVLQEQTIDASIPTSIQNTVSFHKDTQSEAPVQLVNIPSAPVPPVKVCDAKAKSKLSYSEVAKNRPPDYRATAVKKDLPPVHNPPETKPPQNLPDAFPDFTGVRTNKYHSKPRSSRHSKPKKRPLLEPTTIKPDSRYGLDTFEDPVQTSKSGFSDHFSASSGSTPQSRKGSTSSGTGSCEPEDLDRPETLKRSVSTEEADEATSESSKNRLPLSDMKSDSKKGNPCKSGPDNESVMAGHILSGESRGFQRQESKPHNSDRHDDAKRKNQPQKTDGGEAKRPRSSSCNTGEATGILHAKAPTGGKQPVFFDPRRIFESKATLSSNSTSNISSFTNNQDSSVHAEGQHQTKSKLSEAENILNNDKPKTKQNSNISRSCYINNDLRESPTSSKKQTNSDIQRDAGAALGNSDAENIQSQRGSSHSQASHSTSHSKTKSVPSRDNSSGAAKSEPHVGHSHPENHKPEHPKVESHGSSRRYDHGKGGASSKDGRGSGHSRAEPKGAGSRSESRGSCHGKSDGRGHNKPESRNPGSSRQDARGTARPESRSSGSNRQGPGSRYDGRTHNRNDLPPRPKPGTRKNQSDWDQQNAMGELMTQMWQWMMWAGQELGYVMWNITKLTISIGLALLLMMGQYSLSTAKSLWIVIEAKVFRTPSPESPDQPEFKARANFGLKENIVLPSTGDDAMKRLLAEKGSDPYSILGVRADVNDEVLKKYYRRQAVLVHPDKNQTPGAEEAFKILGHAFDLVGEPEKRRHFDTQRMEAQEEEEALHKFADLLTKLHDKMQEATNLMRCENCGGKHRRVPTDRPMYAARYCQKCDYNHPVREGDVWAESHMLGFLWNYYACMDNRVHDITEWASCQCDRFKHIQANAHNVVYRIATNTNTGGRHRQQANHRGTNEADLEDFLSHLFHQTAGANQQGTGAAGPGGGTFTGEGFPGYGQARSGTSSWSQSTSSSSSNKKSRSRRKKRH